jgi:hypothetical protein
MNNVGLKITRSEFKLQVGPKKAIDNIFEMAKRSGFDEHF